SAPTFDVLTDLGYRYTTTRSAVLDLFSGAAHRVPALSQRPGGAAEALGRTVVDGWARRLARRGASARLALHPMDLDNPALVASNLAVIDQFLEAGAKVRTYDQFVTAHRSGAAGRAAYGRSAVGPRILQVANFYTSHSGGLRTTVDALGCAYVDAGVERILVVPGPTDADEDTPAGRRITLRSVRVPGMGGYHALAGTGGV